MRTKLALLLASALTLSAASAAAQTIVDQTGGRLSLTTPGSDQSLKVEVGPVAGVVRVFGFPGISDGQTYSGASGLSILTGAGKDSIEAVLQTPQNFDVSIDTAAGESETKVKWKILSGGTADAATVDINSDTSGAQIAVVEVDSEVQRATVTIRAPSANDATFKIQSSKASNFLRAVVDTAAPKTAVDVSSAASNLQLDMRSNATGAANDLSYAISQSRPATVSAFWAISGSAALDKVEAKLSAPGSNVTQRGSVRAFGGDDNVQFESEGFGVTTGLTLNGGEGNDILIQAIKGRFQMSQTLQTRLFGANGDDALTLTTDAGIYGTGLPNDLNPIIDCGAGVDRYNAFGIIRSCESRF